MRSTTPPSRRRPAPRPRFRYARRLAALPLLVALTLTIAPSRLGAQVPVEGVEDREVYRDSVTFRVPTEPGYEYEADLDGTPVAAGEDVVVDRPDYHELRVLRRPSEGGAEEERTVRFIVRDSSRGNSEWGLPPWTPWSPVASAAEEYDGARIDLRVPSPYPAGLPLPVAAFVRDEATGSRLGVNGTMRASVPEPDGSAIRILRGVGSGLLQTESVAASATIVYAPRLGPLSPDPVSIQIEAETEWTEVSGGEIEADVDWGDAARVHLTGDLMVPDGMRLRVGAGSVVRIAPEVEITVEGELEVAGTAEDLAVFTPEAPDRPWGGIVVRGGSARMTATFAFFTGSGADPSWFSNTSGSGSSHRKEQCLVHLSGGASAEMTEVYAIDLHGQFGHGEGADLTMRRSLVQRCITAGQYNGGTVDLADCALLEFPSATAPFENEDNDGLYLTGGAHHLTNCLVGWALDDGVDAGSGSGGTVEVTRCWFESCYHEGMAWSEARIPTVRDSVAINCGQGIECGFDNPEVDAARCLSTANATGARFGDNYDWDYEGHLTVTDSLLLYNYRDVWGRAWDDWSVHLDQMDVRGNLVTQPDPDFPDNSLWDPSTDAARLEPFLPSPGAANGVGVALSVLASAEPPPTNAPDDEPIRVDLGDSLDALGDAIAVRLSTYTPWEVTVAWYAESADGEPIDGGWLTFPPGQTVLPIPRLSPEEPGTLEEIDALRIRLVDPVLADITGPSEIVAVRTRRVLLVAEDATWRYLDDGSDQGTAWRAPEFDDSAWAEGAAELGYGDGDEATEVDGGPSDDRHPTTYFRHAFEIDAETFDPERYASLEVRLRRDDGGVVYLNGAEVFRSNMDEGEEITYDTWASGNTSSETDWFPKSLESPGELLVAGTNVVAVEVHQTNATSSDISFALELEGAIEPSFPPIDPPPARFLRGDANGDGGIDISDPVGVLRYLFAGAGPPGGALPCDDALDADDSGDLSITDAIYGLAFLFQGGPAPPAPFPEPGPDPTTEDDPLGCDRT